MDPREFQSLAVQFAGGTAAHRRTAISRSYYAVFNVAAAHLRSLGFRIRKGAAAHGEIQHCLANSGDTVVAGIGSELHELHSARIRADYQLDQLDIEQAPVVAQTVAIAGIQILTLDSAFTGPRRPQLQAAIEKWRKENGYP
jgi:hypothetical protein